MDHTFTRADGSGQNLQDRRISKIEKLYAILVCFATNCLSSIGLEASGRSPFGNTVTKSAAFNSLFRRSYALKIQILAANLITALVTTAMMTLGDKYGIPYLYIPWLVNTIRGMAFFELPVILRLARDLLPNTTVPSTAFVLASLFLYVEQLCICSNVFASFQRCWTNYHAWKKNSTKKTVEHLPLVYENKLPCQIDAKRDINVAIKRSRDCERFFNLSDESDSQISMNSSVKSVKSMIEGKNCHIRSRLVDVTG